MFKTTTQYVDMRLYRYAKDKLYGETLNKITYIDFKGGVAREINVPKGFKTDFASIPRIFYCILTPIGKHTQPAILHDYLYSFGYKEGFSRKDSDRVFLEAMSDCGVNVVTRRLMWLAVRLFAFPFYKTKD